LLSIVGFAVCRGSSRWRILRASAPGGKSRVSQGSDRRPVSWPARGVQSQWSMATTHVRDVSPQQMREAMVKMGG
jgi:hypothetical protein